MKAIADHRKKIDELDEHILELIQERVNEAISIRRLKIENGLPLVTPEREEELIQRLIDRANGQLPGKVIKAIWEAIIEGGKKTKDN
ncbi:MAG: chorismate mutase [Candidatus Marinimicrobia bacterium]|nr:chorismate mutase [Candidatus Neomarinimicrobiota bacterium]MCF7851330.1 chorismate mutase [Candidatus Neomarinimicrobiota bacterium]MCF7904321.1 chorismate mutase [Candidatus Neomarinimicrobiota bacterium]